MVREKAQRGPCSRSQTLPARMYRGWAAALTPRSLCRRGPTGALHPSYGGTGRITFPVPLAAPAVRLVLSGRLNILYRDRPGIGVIIEQVATSLAGASVPRGSFPSLRLSPVRPVWRGLLSSLTRGTSSGWDVDWVKPPWGTRCTKIELAGCTLVRPRALKQRSAALAGSHFRSG